MGRTHVHATLRDAILASYRDLEARAPGVQFAYAETGWASGGAFWPHRTHQSGLSVDFVVPLRLASGAPVAPPCALSNGYCYGLEFDRDGRSGAHQIDFVAIAAHLRALEAALRARGGRIERVILWPAYHRAVRAARPGARIPFMTRPSWVRHDDHYHVDVTWTK